MTPFSIKYLKYWWKEKKKCAIVKTREILQKKG